MAETTALLPLSVSLASHPDAGPDTHRCNGRDESIGTPLASNTDPERQVFCHLSLVPRAYRFFSRVSCRISIPSSLSPVSALNARFPSKSFFIRLPRVVDINQSKLTLPTVEGLFAYVILGTCFQDRFAFVSLLLHSYLFLGCVSFSLHYLSPF